jgi:Aldo/keto reductase family
VKFTDSRKLSRRELTGCFVAFGLAVPTVVTIAASPSAAAVPPERTVRFHDGVVVPALGQGSARLGQGRHPEAIEEEALREGISLGMTLIDTAEIYGNGEAERLIGHVIAGQREHVFLVSKVWPTHVVGDGIQRACESSLARLGTTPHSGDRAVRCCVILHSRALVQHMVVRQPPWPWRGPFAAVRSLQFQNPAT